MVAELLIHHYVGSQGRIVALALRGGEAAPRSVSFAPALDPFALEELRWYQEDYRHRWESASNYTVERVQRATRTLGETLFKAILPDEAGAIRDVVRGAGPSLEVRIRDGVHDVGIPWELLADPETGDRLALRARSFVRDAGGGPLRHDAMEQPRLLLIIARPRGTQDVGYWSVAYPLWRSLEGAADITVLRPATVSALGACLTRANRSGAPFTAVHFDGHGIVTDPAGGTNKRVLLVFETADGTQGDLVDGTTLGRLLAQSGVVHLSMNACRSADARAADRILRVDPLPATGRPSVLDEVLGAGVNSAVGMRQMIYPGTAERFFVPFYRALFGGKSAGEAAAAGRVALHAAPLASEAFNEDIVPVDDWSIPIIGERAPVRLSLQEPRLRAPASSLRTTDPSRVPHELCALPTIGSDKPILALEGALARGGVVLITGPLLSGKSRLAVDFARWLSSTHDPPLLVRYVRLEQGDTPHSVAERLLAEPGSETALAETLAAEEAMVIFDQADDLSEQLTKYLTALLRQLQTTCRVIVTARTEVPQWISPHATVRMTPLARHLRVELWRRWNEEVDARQHLEAIYPLLFFSGGLPGVVLLLLDASRNLIARGEADARRITGWLHTGDRDGIRSLSAGRGKDTLDVLADERAKALEAAFGGPERRMLGALMHFQVACDITSAAQLLSGVSEGSVSESDAAWLLAVFSSLGLTHRIPSQSEAIYGFHPFAKLIVARTEGTAPAAQDHLPERYINAVAHRASQLVGRYRHSPKEASDDLFLHKQSMLDALGQALESGRLHAAGRIAEGLSCMCRHDGDIQLLGKVFDAVLPHFLDLRSGMPHPDGGEIALRLWDQAIWLSPNWPRETGNLWAGQHQLRPAVGDFYGEGLLLFAIGKLEEARKALLMAHVRQEIAGRCLPGDIELRLALATYSPFDADTWRDALARAQESGVIREPEDVVGRARSALYEAVFLSVIAGNPHAGRAAAGSAPTSESGPEAASIWKNVGGFLREAEMQPGSLDAEHLAQAALLRAHVMLAHGNVTAAIAHFEEGVPIFMSLQQTSLWGHYWTMSRALERLGWIGKAHELAVVAFRYAMWSCEYGIATEIRERCQHLESLHPELNDRSDAPR